jgi:signal recognition particle receptor subunit beta
MEWLHDKCLQYKETIATKKVVTFLLELDTWSQECLVSDGFISDDELDYISKREDWNYLRFHKIKKANSMVLPEKTQPRLKKKAPVVQTAKKAFKDMQVQFEPQHTFKNNLNVIMVGPSNSGKSTICGQFLVQMGQTKKVEINRALEQGGLQNLVDITEEEKRQGHSIETAKIVISEPDQVITIFDTPGRYVQENVKWAPMAEVAVLVVSAKKCEQKNCEQIQEQLRIAKGSGINQLIVLVNKMDTVKWAKSKFLEIKEAMEP